MIRINCTTAGHDIVTSLSAIREIVNTSSGPVAYIDCSCGAPVILESGVQTWHGSPVGAVPAVA